MPYIRIWPPQYRWKCRKWSWHPSQVSNKSYSEVRSFGLLLDLALRKIFLRAWGPGPDVIQQMPHGLLLPAMEVLSSSFSRKEAARVGSKEVRMDSQQSQHTLYELSVAHPKPKGMEKWKKHVTLPTSQLTHKTGLYV